LALIGGGVLPSSIEVGVSDLSKLEEVGNIAKQERHKEIVESVSLGKTEVKKTIERAVSIQKFITRSSIIAASVFAGVSMLIIFNTIRMAIFTRADEIRTQKLLGATPGYIRGPFLVESGFYGFLAGIISASLVYGSIKTLGQKLSTQAELTASYSFFTDTTNVVIMYAGAISLGVLVGVISSTLALSRYLKIRHW
jgi:cell division transport system permease protein